MSAEFVHLSSIIRSPLVDPVGERIGRVDDLIVRLDGKPHPPITGVVARVAGRELFIPVERIATMRPRFVQLIGQTLALGRFERRPGELLLARDLQARHLIHIVGAHLIRANEIELAETDGLWQVVGVDPSGRGVLRRLMPAPPRPPDPHEVARRLGEHRAVRRPRADRRACGSRCASSPGCARRRSPTSSRRPRTRRARRSSRR